MIMLTQSFEATVEKKVEEKTAQNDLYCITALFAVDKSI